MFNSSVEPPLKSAITFDVLRVSGNIPLLNERLIIRQRGTATMSATIFKNRVRILPWPVAFNSSALMICAISYSEMWAIIKSNWFLFLRNFSGVVWGTLGTVFSVSGPTLTKKMLKELAISRG